MDFHCGELIKRMRTKMGWTQKELAEKLGFKTHSAVSKIENKLDFDIELFIKVIRLTNSEEMVIEDLFGDEGLEMMHKIKKIVER